jgi:cyclopropane-fatty-acyl-phospholipid synthase
MNSDTSLNATNIPQCFLSREMLYSTALFDSEEGGPAGDLANTPTKPDALEKAQMRKIQYILRKARLVPGSRVLEFGSGWGAVAIEAGKLGCTVESITLSAEQKNCADQRIEAAGLSDRVRIHLCDYRKLPASFENSFDAIISIEMVEHVGAKHQGEFFRVIDWALKKERGAVVISSTTRPEYRYSDYQAEDFSRRYHWPNAHASSPTSLISVAYSTLKGKLVVHSVEDHGVRTYLSIPWLCTRA